MKLKTKKISFTDANGNEIDVEGVPVEILLNGEPSGLKLNDVLHGHREYDDGEIYCQTLLSYFDVKEDGKLYFENSYVELVTPTGALKVTRISRPSTHDDTRIDFDTLNKFVQQLGITHPDKLFTDLLSDAQKQEFVQAREQRSASAQGVDTAETERQTAVNADEELRAQVDPHTSVLHEEAGIKDLRRYYKENGCKEYTSGAYRLFFGSPSTEPCLFIQRGTANPAYGLKEWWEEPDQTPFEGEEPNELVIEFTDLSARRELVFNKETGDIKIKE
jgi:hypothetical protein